jgi:hypothetical protein
MFGQVATERNASILYIGELNNGNCDALLPVEGKGRMNTFEEVWFLWASFAENILLYRSSRLLFNQF